MINVVGKTLDEAKKLIEAKGLKVEIKYSENKKKKDNIVLEQSVKEKEKIEKGKTITLTVNKIEKQNPIINDINSNEVNTNTTVTNTTI